MLGSNAQKTPYAFSINEFAQAKVRAAIQLLGKSLPASVTAVNGSIVTVAFQVDATPYTLPKVQVPLAGPEYIRYPTQIGDKGYVAAADVRLGGVTGLGSGLPKLNQPGNLSALVFVPLGSTNFSPTDDTQAVVIYGPNGVILRDTGKSTTLTLTPSGIVVTGQTTIKLQVGSSSVTISSSGVDIEGTLTINGHAYLAHMHNGVQSGGSNSGPVVP
jgi:hypothetical protein